MHDAKFRDYPRVVDPATFTPEANKANFAMADVAATVLWKYDQAVLEDFLDGKNESPCPCPRDLGDDSGGTKRLHRRYTSAVTFYDRKDHGLLQLYHKHFDNHGDSPPESLVDFDKGGEFAEWSIPTAVVCKRLRFSN